MLPTAETLEFLRSLEPPAPHWQGTGAVRRHPDARDYPATHHPDVRAALAAGVPDSFDISSSVCEILNQGASGACVAYSTCHGIQVNNNLDSRVCYHFAADQLYRELGGTGANGVDSRATLQRCEDVGAPTTAGNRVRTGSYFWIDQTPGTFEQQVKAALSTGKAVVIALLLPSTFAGVWTPGARTSGYHQVCMTKYGQASNPDLFGGPNSWGSDWGNHGFYELAFSYVLDSNLQNDYCFAYFFDTLTVTPPPPVGRAATVTGRAVSTDPSAVWPPVGSVVSIGTGVTLIPSSIVFDNPNPNPPPPPPPGGLVVGVASGIHHILAVTVKDATGAYVDATCQASVGATNLGTRLTHPAGGSAIPAVWTTIGIAPGSAVTVTAATADGRTGSGVGTTS